MKAVAESAMREIVGQTQIQKILTADRKLIEPASQALMQKVLDDYHAGVLVLQVLSSFLVGIGLSCEGQQFVFGLLILPMVAIYARSPHIRTRI